MFRGEKLRHREVVDVQTAERLGYVWDLEIDEKDGRITAIVVIRGGWWRRLFGMGEFIIPWGEIAAVGDKYVLADMRKVYIK